MVNCAAVTKLVAANFSRTAIGVHGSRLVGVNDDVLNSAVTIKLVAANLAEQLIESLTVGVMILM